jgi:hypothetical protein
MTNTTLDRTDDLATIHARLAAFAEEQPTTSAVEELRLIRACLRQIEAGHLQARASPPTYHGRSLSRVVTQPAATNHRPWNGPSHVTRLERALVLLATVACLVALAVAAIEVSGYWFI